MVIMARSCLFLRTMGQIQKAPCVIDGVDPDYDRSWPVAYDEMIVPSISVAEFEQMSPNCPTGDVEKSQESILFDLTFLRDAMQALFC